MDKAQSQYVRLCVVHAVMGAVASFMVCLRFMARRKQRLELQWDDWFIVLTLALMWGDFTCNNLGEIVHLILYGLVSRIGTSKALVLFLIIALFSPSLLGIPRDK
jgi:hypothetical protein